MTALTWAARIGTLTEEPSGVPSTSVTTSVTLWMPSLAGPRVQQHGGARPRAGMSTAEGPEIVIGSSGDRVDADGHRLVEPVDQGRGEPPAGTGERHRRGATIRTEASWVSIHLRERWTEARAGPAARGWSRTG